jgi:peptidoglycan-associated lipoprotein
MQRTKISIFPLFFIIFLAINPSFLSGQTNKNTAPSKPAQKKKVEMTFDKELIHLGKVKKGESRKFDFAFTNTGIDPIEIDIISSCDCTTLDWPRKPIKPGQKGIINVTFDSTKKEISETIDIDIYLKNIDQKTGHRTLKIINYDYELVK